MNSGDDLQASTVLEYLSHVTALDTAGDVCWFRGVGKASYELVPSLFRHPTIQDPVGVHNLELELLRRFRERSIPYQVSPWNRDRDQEWEALFIMQHFGVPTRLLDWSESPLVGLYFALTSARVDPVSLSADQDACVWLLRPAAWNQMALSDISFHEGVLSIGGNGLLDSYAPSGDFSFMRLKPVAMNGLHNSPRIVAQKGTFTIFGKSLDPMESHAAPRDGSQPILRRIILPAESIGKLRQELARMGVTDSVVYPDLEGLAREMKRHYGFNL